MADYLRGHPDHPNPVKGGTLTVDDGGLLFVKSVAGVLPLPGVKQAEGTTIALPAEALRAVSVGSLRKAGSLMVGGLVPVGDDALVGLGGKVGGGESGAISCLVDLAGERAVVLFWAEADASRALVEGLNRDRMAGGLRPLPSLQELHAREEAAERADGTDAILVEIRDLLRELVALQRPPG